MTFADYDATETIRLTNLAQVAELYERALVADAAMNFTTEPRLYWTDAPEDLRRLRSQWLEGWNTLQGWAQTSNVTINGHSYRGHALRG
jgi:hypothetical protein